MPEGHTARYADNPVSALSIKFKVGEHWAVAARNEAFPPLNVGDEVEVSGEVNASSGVLEVQSLHNRTVGATWKSAKW